MLSRQTLSVNNAFFTSNVAVGGDGGRQFYFGCEGNDPTSGRVVRSLQAWVNKVVFKALEVEFTDGTIRTAGVKNGTPTEKFYIANGEKISSLQMWGGGWQEGRSGGFKLQTDRGREFNVFTPDRIGYPYRPPLGSGILVGVFGRAAADIDALGFALLHQVKAQRATAHLDAGFALLRRVKKAQLTCADDPNLSTFIVVSIDGMEYSPFKVPTEQTALVLDRKNMMLGEMDFDKLAKSLSTIGLGIGLLYNCIGITGPEFVDLQAQVLHISSNVTRLCDDSTPTTATIKEALAQLSDLPTVYEDLLTNYEERALTTLATSGRVAGKLKEATETLSKDFDKQSEKVNATICMTFEKVHTNRHHPGVEYLHTAINVLQQLLTILMEVRQFCSYIQNCAGKLMQPLIHSVVERAIKSPEEERLRLWTSDILKRRVLFFQAEWVALQSVVNTYLQHVALSKIDLYEYIKENPTREQYAALFQTFKALAKEC